MRYQNSARTVRQFAGSVAGHIASLVAGLVFLVGCRTPQLGDIVVGASYQPQNVHRSKDGLAFDMRRVAVLPVTCDVGQNQVECGRDLLAQILPEELGKTKRFELISISAEKLKQWTGRPAWSAEERLPADFFKRLRDELDCDAVLFGRVTQFHAYPPLVVGLQLRLVELQTATQIWTVDEVLDAAEPSVMNGARRYQQAQEPLPPGLADSRSILNSPRRFSQYAASTLFATLPAR